MKGRKVLVPASDLTWFGTVDTKSSRRSSAVFERGDRESPLLEKSFILLHLQTFMTNGQEEKDLGPNMQRTGQHEKRKQYEDLHRKHCC